ncbi:regulatory protein MarR [Sphingobium chlorophenolicum L-1]|uniref:Regulatory protein MarR n=2 Tax=Sphingobium chlorophenolicum TaxID=46429 RepID=F6F269_SPHCR|nr:MarR family transcriptional regulator [Sphingobium chlorophenolicum]AEG50569.1 regulatory protein MarR [Sphingobium chlorophenolicum L-1]KEQ53811.1 Regulatory protein MarR [Sphingobium chlorophenolicum]
MNLSDEQLLTDLSRVITLMRRSFDRAMTEQGASLAQTKLLTCIKAQSGTARAADIAEIMSIAPRTVTEALDGLEREGLIQRTPDKADRRVKRLTLTPAGEAAVAVTEPLRRELSAKMLAALNPSDRAHFHAALQKLLEALADG